MVRTALVAVVLALGAAPFVPLPTPLSAQAKLIDINSASEKQLESLPGIGAARARAIVKHRPYKKTEEIVTKTGIPRSVYEVIKSKITAR